MILTEKLLLFCLFLQTCELWQVRSAFSDQSIWRSRDLRLDPTWLNRFILSAKSFEGLLLLRLVMIVAAAFDPTSTLFLFLFVSQLLIQIRLHGPFNGGSDYLTTLALAVIWIQHSFPQHPLVAQMCLLYLGLQVCLSYFVAGVVKLKQAPWRQGTALKEFLLAGKYQIPANWKKRASEDSSLLKIGTLGVLVFELSFPVSLLNPSLCIAWMLAGVFFHWMNYRVFGLNRFFWIWLACYPALFETAQWISARL